MKFDSQRQNFLHRKKDRFIPILILSGDIRIQRQILAVSMDSAEEKEQRAHVEEEGEEEEGEEEEVEEEEAEVELEGEERAAVTENAKPTVHNIRLQIQRRMSANY
jgi:hypothetical protein